MAFALACLVLGCAGTVYSNIFAADVYPTLSIGVRASVGQIFVKDLTN